jgi:hypothetical protein
MIEMANATAVIFGQLLEVARVVGNQPQCVAAARITHLELMLNRDGWCRFQAGIAGRHFFLENIYG